jgi:hypothetical protein
MPSESKIIRLLSELTKLTSKGELKWRVKDPPEALTHGTNDVFPLYCEAEYKNQTIGLAQRRYQQYDGDRDRFYWNEEIALIFVDDRGRVLWEDRSQWAALTTLFETVREKVADVDGILKNLLGDDEDDL